MYRTCKCHHNQAAYDYLLSMLSNNAGDNSTDIDVIADDSIKKCLQSLRRYPLPVTNLAEASRLHGVTDSVAKIIVKSIDCSLVSIESLVNSNNTGIINTTASSCSNNTYVPEFGKSPWGILVSLIRCGDIADKRTIKDRAIQLEQELSIDGLVDRISSNFSYSIKVLVNKGLVRNSKSNNNNNGYSLTELGKEVAADLLNTMHSKSNHGFPSCSGELPSNSALLNLCSPEQNRKNCHHSSKFDWLDITEDSRNSGIQCSDTGCDDQLDCTDIPVASSIVLASNGDNTLKSSLVDYLARVPLHQRLKDNCNQSKEPDLPIARSSCNDSVAHSPQAKPDTVIDLTQNDDQDSYSGTEHYYPNYSRCITDLAIPKTAVPISDVVATDKSRNLSLFSRVIKEASIDNTATRDMNSNSEPIPSSSQYSSENEDIFTLLNRVNTELSESSCGQKSAALNESVADHGRKKQKTTQSKSSYSYNINNDTSCNRDCSSRSANVSAAGRSRYGNKTLLRLPSSCNFGDSTSAGGVSQQELAVLQSEWEVVLYVDKRERSNALIQASMVARNIPCELHTLAVGDFLWVARRKTIYGSHLNKSKRTCSSSQKASTDCSSSSEACAGQDVQFMPPPEVSLLSQPDMGMLPSTDSVSNKQDINSVLMKNAKSKAVQEAVEASEKSSRLIPTIYVLDCIAERKAIPDLVSSITDGRYMEQKSRLKACNLRCSFYIIEGEHLSVPMQQKAISVAHLKTAMTSINVDSRMHVVRTRGMDHTITHLQALHNQVCRRFYSAQCGSPHPYYQSFTEFQQLYGKKAASTNKQLFGHMLRQIQGCGTAAAVTLIDRFGTFANFLCSLRSLGSRAKVEYDIATIPIVGSGGRKIGPKLAKRICQICDDYY